MHLLVLTLISHLVLQIVTFVEPELPFSKPLVKGSSSSRVFGIMIVVVALAGFLPYFMPLIYRNTATTIAGIVGGRDTERDDRPIHAAEGRGSDGGSGVSRGKKKPEVFFTISPTDLNANATNVSVPFVQPPVGNVGDPTTNRFS